MKVTIEQFWKVDRDEDKVYEYWAYKVTINGEEKEFDSRKYALEYINHLLKEEDF